MKALLLCLCLMAFAGYGQTLQQQQAYRAGQHWGTEQQTPLIDSRTVEDVQGFQANALNEIPYTAEHVAALAKEAAVNNPQARFITQLMQTHPPVAVDANAPWLEKSKASMAQAYPNASYNPCPDNGWPCHAAPLASPDFKPAVSNLAVFGAGAKDFVAYHMFTGQRLTCRYDGFDYNDCCQDKGWGQNLHLAGCTRDEKALGQAKEAGRCHKLGRYCDKRVLGLCLRHKESACCFQTKLGRLVQEQGRVQLHIPWGSEASPNCRGLTPDELQRMDFTNMDFHEFYPDLEKKVLWPDKKTFQQRVKAFYERAQSS